MAASVIAACLGFHSRSEANHSGVCGRRSLEGAGSISPLRSSQAVAALNTERAAGSMLFERMLEFNMPQAMEMTLDLDKRMPVGGSPRAPLRRRLRAKQRRPTQRT